MSYYVQYKQAVDGHLIKRDEFICTRKSVAAALSSAFGIAGSVGLEIMGFTDLVKNVGSANAWALIIAGFAIFGFSINVAFQFDRIIKEETKRRSVCIENPIELNNDDHTDDQVGNIV